MLYTYEVKEVTGGWIVQIFKDNFLIQYQPHHPQQDLTADGEFWKSQADATAWAEESIHGMNNPELFSAPVNAEPPAVLPDLTKEQEANNLKAHLASLLNVSVDQISIQE